MTLKDTVWGVGIAVDDDNALVASSLEEYYLDNGALFTAQVCTQVTVAAGEKLEVEFMQKDDVRETRLFNVSQSTLCDKFSLITYELPARDTTGWTRGEGQDYIKYPLMKPNRLNVKEFPIETVRLQVGKAYGIEPWDSEETAYSVDDYVRYVGEVYKCTTANTTKEPGEDADWENDWDHIGEIVDLEYYILEEAGGPQASDTGFTTQRSTQVQMKNSEKNYLIEITNHETEGSKDFAIGFVLGVSDYLE